MLKIIKNEVTNVTLFGIEILRSPAPLKTSIEITQNF